MLLVGLKRDSKVPIIHMSRNFASTTRLHNKQYFNLYCQWHLKCFDSPNKKRWPVSNWHQYICLCCWVGGEMPCSVSCARRKISFWIHSLSYAQFFLITQIKPKPIAFQTFERGTAVVQMSVLYKLHRVPHKASNSVSKTSSGMSMVLGSSHPNLKVCESP